MTIVFNEGSCSNRVQQLIIEVGLFDVFDKINRVEKHQRSEALENGSERTEFILAIE